MEENKENVEKEEIGVGKVLEGTIGYRIELGVGEYGLKFDRSVESELLAMMVTRELLRYNKGVLQKSLEQVGGKMDGATRVKKNQLKDRLRKIGGGEYILQFMIEGVIGELLEGGLELEPGFEESGITPEGLADSLLAGKKE